MITGRINGKTSNVNIESKIEWTATASSVSQTSNVTAKLYLRRTNTGYTTSGTGTFALFINGIKHQSNNVALSIKNDWVLAMTASEVVKHLSDGTKKITISAEGSLPPSSLTAIYCMGDVVLEKISVGAKIKSAASVNTGESCNIIYLPNKAEHTYVFRFELGDTEWTSGTLSPNTTAPCLFDGYTFDVETWAKEIKTMPPNASVKVLLYTYENGQLIGTDESYFLLYVLASEELLPEMTFSVEPKNVLQSKFEGLYIQGKSKIKANILTTQPKYGATVSSIVMSFGDVSYTQTPYESDFVNESGIVSLFINDSRGFYREYTQQIDVIPYSNPQIVPATNEKTIVCERSDSEGNPSEDGNYLHIKLKRKYSLITDNASKNINTCTVTYAIAEDGTDFSEEVPILDATSLSDEFDGVLSLGLSARTNYVVRLNIFDDIDNTSTPKLYSVPSELIFMHKAAMIRSLGFGEYVKEPNTISIADDISVNLKGVFKFKGQTVPCLPIEKGEVNGWSYTKYSDGSFTAVGLLELTTQHAPTSLGAGYLSEVFEIQLPFEATEVTSVADAFTQFIPSKVGNSGNNTSIYYQFLNFYSWTIGTRIKTCIFVQGRY